MKIDELPVSVKDHMHSLCGAMDIPNLYSFYSVEHFLREVQNRISQTKSFIGQAMNTLGSGSKQNG